MIFSYTQISNYLRCPRSYRLRYLDGWQERDTRAGMVFGRCFEQAVAALFCRQDPEAKLFQEWGAYRDTALHYKNGDSWDRVLHQGVHLLQRFAQDDRIRIRDPHKNLQVKILQSLSGGHQFISYLDAIGTLDGTPCILDWKTTTSRYPEGPVGVLSLDPQLISYSWASGIPAVAIVAFVRKQAPEIQYLKSSITEEQRQEFARLLDNTVGQIEAGQFTPHSGIRYPQNGCLSCSHLGLCLKDQQLIDRHLIRKPGVADLDWLDELVD
jgi:hypothetical protein